MCSLLTDHKVNTLLDSNNIVHNMNHVDQTGSLQNACPMLQTAHFSVSSRYRLADFSQKLPVSSFTEWTLRAHDIVTRTGLPNYKAARIEVNTS